MCTLVDMADCLLLYLVLIKSITHLSPKFTLSSVSNKKGPVLIVKNFFKINQYSSLFSVTMDGPPLIMQEYIGSPETLTNPALFSSHPTFHINCL